jgi:hypothetical protein
MITDFIVMTAAVAREYLVTEHLLRRLLVGSASAFAGFVLSAAGAFPGI